MKMIERIPSRRKIYTKVWNEKKLKFLQAWKSLDLTTENHFNDYERVSFVCKQNTDWVEKSFRIREYTPQRLDL